MCASTSKSSPQGPNRGGATGGGPMALAHASPAPRRAMPVTERHSWRVPPLALLKPVAWSPGTKLGMLMLRGYLLISVLLPIVKAVQLRGGEPAARKPPHVAATSRRPRAGGIINMAILTVAARLFRNRAHAEISTSQQAHAGCGQLVAGLTASGPRRRPARLPDLHLKRGDLCRPVVMQSFAGLNIPSSSAGPSPWARASPCRHLLRPGQGTRVQPSALSFGILFALTLPRPAHPRPRT